jgi:serine protease AprX
VRMDSGKRNEERSSALWGTGNRGGETRSNALWGKGGRGFVTALVAALAVCVPLASSSNNEKPAIAKAHRSGVFLVKRTYIAPVLEKRASKRPNTKMSVIIQSNSRFVLNHQVRTILARSGIKKFKKLRLIDGVAATISARHLADLATVQGLTVTPDAPVHVSGYNSSQLWPYAAGVASDWNGANAPPTGANAPAIAIVDSGIQADRPDFAGRVLASVNLSTLTSATNDERGHGTFVAGVAAGAAKGYAGAVPQANLVAIKVMDANGMAKTSDVINACQWILTHKGQYNIRVANFSLHSANKASFLNDPLDKAVEKLWFNGVVVVAAAGNYANNGEPSGVLYAPGNDPFVITVGAVDLKGSADPTTHTNAPFSAYGYTPDGFSKPDIGAPGRYIVGPVPMNSTLAIQRADAITAPGYIQLSGTSFAAPAVSGAAAQILAAHPGYTPDQVKGALMVSARPDPAAAPGSVGVGELRMGRAVLRVSPPNPNLGLDQFVGIIPGDTAVSFDAHAWFNTAKVNPSWDAVSWSSAAWSGADFDAVAWSDVSWESVSWETVAWSDVSWEDVAWSDVAWSDVSWEDAAEGDANDTGGYDLTPAQVAAIMADPDIAPDPNDLPEDVQPPPDGS